MFSKIKLWAAASLAFVAAVGIAALHIFNAGKSVQHADSIVKAQKDEKAFDSRINAGHTAGNAARVQPVQNDPNDRANR